MSRRRQISSKPFAIGMHCLQKCGSADLGILYGNNNNAASPIFPPCSDVGVNDPLFF